MHDCEDAALLARWFPLAAARELPARHVFHAQLLGEELALWRADDGTVNAWENRCPHRGVRLSIGVNLGSELRCQYHGMRFAGGSGQCTLVPAHPNTPPSKMLHTHVYPCVERHGFVWSALAPASTGPEVPALAGETTTLRSLPVNAAAATVVAGLHDYRFPDGAATIAAIDAFTLTASAGSGDARRTVLFLVQPVTRDRSVVHGAVLGAVAAGQRLAVLRQHNDQLTELRRAIEAAESAMEGAK